MHQSYLVQRSKNGAFVLRAILFFEFVLDVRDCRLFPALGVPRHLENITVVSAALLE